MALDSSLVSGSARARVASVAAWLIDESRGLSDLMYGNVGAQNRLDFTVIGAAVHEASRLEGLCKVVYRPLLASAAFVETLGSSGLSRPESMGAHSLKGVGRPVEVFGLRAHTSRLHRSPGVE